MPGNQGEALRNFSECGAWYSRTCAISDFGDHGAIDTRAAEGPASKLQACRIEQARVEG
jgi:hypothetical protein